MIKNKDRSGWIGSSDCYYVMSGWNTKSFARWWNVKLGLLQNNFVNIAMLAGTHYEHKILNHLGVKKRDRQIKIRRYRLRVNLDGETSMIHEVKTYSDDEFRVNKAYWQQAQVQMFATNKPLQIVAYRLLPEDYENFYNPIDPERLSFHPVRYDDDWIKHEYLPRVVYLARCMRQGRIPSLSDMEKCNDIHSTDSERGF